MERMGGECGGRSRSVRGLAEIELGGIEGGWE